MSIDFLRSTTRLAPRGGSFANRLTGIAIAAIATVSVVNAQFVIYNSVPSPLPGNVASVGFEASGANELGDGLIFAPGQARTVTTVKVIMSDWACLSGHWFNPVGSPGSCVTNPANSTFSLKSHHPTLT